MHLAFVLFLSVRRRSNYWKISRAVKMKQMLSSILDFPWRVCLPKIESISSANTLKTVGLSSVRTPLTAPFSSLCALILPCLVNIFKPVLWAPVMAQLWQSLLICYVEAYVIFSGIFLWKERLTYLKNISWSSVLCRLYTYSTLF